jgi:4-hydroxybenzoate polyprenyltransferase
MKTLLRISVIIVGVAIVATIIYFFVSGVVLSVLMSLLMFAILGIVVCEQVRSEKEDGQPKSKFYFRFFICGVIFQFVVTIALIASGNFAFSV